jgi:hypothetical protein
MKFYICHDSDCQIFDCCFTLKEAKQIVHNAGGGEVSMIDVPIDAETVRHLLGKIGMHIPNQYRMTIN